MDTTVPNPPIIPQSETPPVYGPVQTKDAPKIKSNFVLNPVVIILTVIILLLVGLLVFTSGRRGSSTVAPMPTPTNTPVPTPVRALSSYATQSAFIAFQQSVGTLSTSVQNVVLNDQTITPPTLVLPLGFSIE